MPFRPKRAKGVTSSTKRHNIHVNLFFGEIITTLMGEGGWGLRHQPKSAQNTIPFVFRSTMKKFYIYYKAGRENGLDIMISNFKQVWCPWSFILAHWTLYAILTNLNISSV